MGKRELLLVAAFVVMGVLVYQVTAPPPAPGERSFSIGQILNNVRRELRGNRASAQAASTTAYPIGKDLAELHLRLGSAEVTVTGEDRKDLEAELRVQSSGYDPAEAERLAKEVALKFDEAGASLRASIDYPEAGRQTATINLKVPLGLSIRLERARGRVRISNVKAVVFQDASGDIEVGKVAERVSGTLIGGDLKVNDAGSLKLTTRGTDLTVEHVRGESIIGTRAGELRGTDLAGSIELDSNSTDVTLDKLGTTTGTVRINAIAGTVTVRGLRAEGRIDARNAEVSVAIDRAAPFAIYSEGGEDIRITAPPGGYQIDAVAEHGRVVLPEGRPEVESSGERQRASGAVRGGGATITIRSERGDIVVTDPVKAER